MTSAVITLEKGDVDYILEHSPKGIKALIDFIQDMFNRSVPEGAPVEKVDVDMASSILYFAPRTLYDFFDGNSVYISLSRKGEKFGGVVGTTKIALDFPRRHDVERLCFLEAFKQLETKLV